MDTQNLLQIARRGNTTELVAMLELETRATHATQTRGQRLTEDEKLLDEALWYARQGDLDEAIYRLEQSLS